MQDKAGKFYLVFDKSRLYPILLALFGPAFSGIAIHFVLTSLLIPSRITYPICFLISLAIFGITMYYAKYSKNEQSPVIHRESVLKNSALSSEFLFVGLYIFIIVFAFLSNQNPQIYVRWEQVSALDIIRLVAAIAICGFAPGYALIASIDRKNELSPLAKFLIAYLLSILVTGFVGYTSASLGFPVAKISTIIGIIN